jgi:hypothetical protein
MTVERISITAMYHKHEFFLTSQLLWALYDGDLQSAKEHCQALGNWLDNRQPLAGSQLPELLRKLAASQNTSMREYNTLRDPLAAAVTELLSKINARLFLHEKILPSVSRFVRNGVEVKTVKNNSEVPAPDDSSIHILLTSEEAQVVRHEEKINRNDPCPCASGRKYKKCCMDSESAAPADKADIAITYNELKERAQACFPIDSFVYDRLYLSGKLNALSSNRKNTSVLLGGSSYAMVGLIENLMPRPAVNLAVNAQDPYFALLSAERAKESAKKIDTIIITGGYYFWHFDLSDNPSSYTKSVLTRTNYPVLKDLHNYTGDLPPALLRGVKEPLFESIFDFNAMCEDIYGKVSERLAFLSYFNNEIHKRPPNGMLNFPFREQNDELNYKAAKARAGAHNGQYNITRLENNLKLLSEFMLKMNSKNVRVLLIIPPVTVFYRHHSDLGLKETFYERLEPLKRELGVEVIDLFESTDFDVSDFQDYDHLNDSGAKKLSLIAAQWIG